MSASPPRILAMVERELNRREWPDAFIAELRRIGTLRLIEQGGRLGPERIAAEIRAADVLITCHGSVAVPPEIVRDRGALRYLCHLHGELREFVPLPLIDTGVAITNWGPGPAELVAEGAMVLLMAVLKDLHRQILNVRADGWKLDRDGYGGTLAGMPVGIYGAGFIGLRFIELIRPFKPIISVYDPYASSIPVDCNRAGSLRELFASSYAIVIHAGLTDETRGSVSADLLALLPDSGIIVNTARGDIVDQEALFAEIARGRLRAGLDVLQEPDDLPAGHPARCYPGCILTAHNIGCGWPTDGRGGGKLDFSHAICLENLGRFLRGEPLKYPMTRERYLRST